jgi:hypothetical protein
MAMNASLENVLSINTTHWRIPDALANAFKNIPPSPIFPYVFGTLVALDPWGGMILKIRDPKPRRLHYHNVYLPTPAHKNVIFWFFSISSFLFLL